MDGVDHHPRHNEIFRYLKLLTLGKEIQEDVDRSIGDCDRNHKEDQYQSQLSSLTQRMSDVASFCVSNVAMSRGFYEIQLDECEQFLGHALELYYELKREVELCFDLGYFDELQKYEISEKLQVEMKLLKRLMESLKPEAPVQEVTYSSKFPM